MLVARVALVGHLVQVSELVTQNRYCNEAVLCSYQGGAVYQNNCLSNNIRNTVFDGNKAQQGSALFLNNSVPVRASLCIFELILRVVMRFWFTLLIMHSFQRPSGCVK